MLLETIIGDVIRYILFAHTNKEAIPRLHINNIINKRAQLGDIINDVKTRLQDVFGFKLVAAQDTWGEVSLQEKRLLWTIKV
jgi:hypothetical protein